MKYLVLFSLLIILISPLSAQQYLDDVPRGHYAYDSVQDLVRLGVTNGYPDGTFRGRKKMDRYGLASFISNFAQSYQIQKGQNSKLVEELKTETSLVVYEQKENQRNLQTFGGADLRWRHGVGGGAADYRLIAGVKKNFGRNASLKATLDTMDAGYGGTTRDLVRQLLDFEARAKAGALELRFTEGAGDIVHYDNGLFPMDNLIRYRRPKRTLGGALTLGRTTLLAEYLARSAFASGSIEVAELSAKLYQDLSLVKFVLNPRLFTRVGGERDLRLELSTELAPSAAFNLVLLGGLAKTTEYPHGLYLRADLKIGTGIWLLAQKIGSQYRQQISYGIFDIFDRNLSDGTTNYGLELKKDFLAGWFASCRAAYTDPGQIVTTDWQLGRTVASRTALALSYQTYQASVAVGLVGKVKI